MRKLKVIEHISLDGVIQVGADKDGDYSYGDWSAPYRSPEGLAMILPEWGERFDLVIGRRTYDMWSGFWPKAPKSPMADRLNAATKYVVTHRPDSLEWGPFEGIGPDLVEGVRAIKVEGRPGPDRLGQLDADSIAARTWARGRDASAGQSCTPGQRKTSFRGRNSATRICAREHEGFADRHCSSTVTRPLVLCRT